MGRGKTIVGGRGVGIQRLIDYVDLAAKEELGEYLIVSKSRIDNLIGCFEGGAKRIKELTEIINEQQETIRKLSIDIAKEDQLEAEQ